MRTGWVQRVTVAAGTAGLTAAAVLAANDPTAQAAVTALPVVGSLEPTTLSGGALELAVLTAVTAVVVACLPLCAPRPRRAVDVVFTTERRLLVAVTALAAVGYFDYTYRLPRTTLVLVTALLAVALPAWFGLVVRRPRNGGHRTVVVGDDPARMAEAVAASEATVVGVVAPPTVVAGGTGTAMADGGRLSVDTDVERAALADFEYLGGFSRLESALLDNDADTAVLAFGEADRAEFFGTLSVCLDNGVTAKVHAEHADHVLTDAPGEGPLVEIDLEPWSPTGRLAKRVFDVCFAVAGLVAMAPVMAAIAVAVRREDGGPVLYGQRRTTTFGGTVTVWKFRTMTPEGERAAPVADAENDRITRVGRVLRRTHLDELPQLWTVLQGEMSVVGPRAAWVAEESAIAADTAAWRKRWFVKPGLTGLAQVNGVDSTDPGAKLRYDVTYIRRQSLALDLRIVAYQVWLVVRDCICLIRGR